MDPNFGATDKFLLYNEGELANAEFLQMCEPMKITVKVTAAESPLSNGLVERQNFIITDMKDKTFEETQVVLILHYPGL